VYANPTSPRAARFIAALPVEAWSPGLGRMVRISEKQRDVLAIVSKQHAHRLRHLALEAGYADAASMSRALRSLQRLGLIAVSSSRGRHGSTVAWVRAGARMAQSLAQLMRQALDKQPNVSPPSTVLRSTYQRSTDRVVSDREDTLARAAGPPRSLADVLAGLLGRT